PQSKGFHATNTLLARPQPPHASCALNDRKAVGAIQAPTQTGNRVGQDFGGIGFTNDPIATVIEPNLTTIEEPAFEIGCRSCQVLIRHIKNKDFEPREILIPGKLIERQSV